MLIQDEEIFFVDYHLDSNKKMLYAPLRSYLALISKEKIEEIYAGAPLVLNEILCRIKRKPRLDIDKILLEIQNATPELSLAITENCNLKCSYCHASAGEMNRKNNNMSNELIDSIVEQYFKNINFGKTVKIKFDGGGEPTCELELLKYAINKINECSAEKNITPQFSMSTNGYYTKEVTKFVMLNFHSVSLSFDGPAHIQNNQRPTNKNRQSFEKVFNTAKEFYENGFKFSFRATITDYSVNYFEDIIKFFKINFPNITIGIEKLNQYGRAEVCKDCFTTPPSSDLFTKKLIQFYTEEYDNPLLVANSASTKYNFIKPVFCSSVGVPNWNVTKDGIIKACTMNCIPKDFIFGRFDSKTKTIKLSVDSIRKIREKNVLNFEKCKDCFCKYHCAGDCHERRISNSTDCNSIKKIGAHILAEKITHNALLI